MRMAYQPLEELLPKASMSVYRLVRLASMRATELANTGAGCKRPPGEDTVSPVCMRDFWRVRTAGAARG